MEIVIAILLALILIALVSGNKDAANSVGKVIRIGLFLFLISLSWFILIGYSIFYFFSYTDKGWYSALGIVALVIIPPLFAWGNQLGLNVLFGPSHKESSGCMQLKQSGIVYVGLVHHVKGAGLDVALFAKDIEYLDVVHLAVADVDKTGNRSLQVDQSMKFDGGFGGAKWSPTEQTQTQIDGRLP